MRIKHLMALSVALVACDENELADGRLAGRGSRRRSWPLPARPSPTLHTVAARRSTGRSCSDSQARERSRRERTGLRRRCAHPRQHPHRRGPKWVGARDSELLFRPAGQRSRTERRPERKRETSKRVRTSFPTSEVHSLRQFAVMAQLRQHLGERARSGPARQLSFRRACAAPLRAASSRARARESPPRAR